MEDFGDILYVIFALIAIVYSVIKKGAQKAKEATPPIFEQDEDNESFEPDDRTIKGAPGSRATVMQPATMFRHEPLQARVIDNAMEEKKRQMEQNFKRIKRTSALKKTIEQDETDTGTDFMSNFDLREAVIYSEVLKRPKF